MVIRNKGKLVILTGCAHRGILNIIEAVGKHFEGMPIKAVIGGSHLVTSPPFNGMAGTRQEVEEIGRAVLDYPVEMTYTDHCTGTKALKVLKSVMGDRVSDIRTGTRFEV